MDTLLVDEDEIKVDMKREFWSLMHFVKEPYQRQQRNWSLVEVNQAGCAYFTYV